MHKTLVSRIYAPAQRHDKDEFWKHLIELNTFINTPWCLVGDVNKLGAPNEKKGGGQILSINKFERINNSLATIEAELAFVNGKLFI